MPDTSSYIDQGVGGFFTTGDTTTTINLEEEYTFTTILRDFFGNVITEREEYLVTEIRG